MKSPAFQFYVKQWLGDDKVMLMSSSARALHMHFMCIAWQQEPACTLPDDDGMLQAWAANMPDWIDLRQHWPKLKEEVFRAWAFIKEKGRWIQSGLLEQYKKQHDTSDTKRLAANVRWAKHRANKSGQDAHIERPEAHPAPDARAMHMQCPSTSTSSSLVEEVEEGRPAPLRKRFAEAARYIRSFEPGAQSHWIERLLDHCVKIRPNVTDSELISGLQATKRKDQRGASWWAKVLPNYIESLADEPCQTCFGKQQIFRNDLETIDDMDRAERAGQLYMPCPVCQPTPRIPPGKEQAALFSSAGSSSG